MTPLLRIPLRRRRQLLAWVLAPILLLTPDLGQAQQWFRASEPNLEAELRVAGANMVLGGASAVIVAGLSGHSMRDALWKGVSGGALTYAGKRVAAERGFGAGALGRQIGMVGGSMTRNGGQGRGALDQVTLAFGPLRWHHDREESGRRWGIDVPAMGVLAWGILDSRMQLDLGESFSSGATVFVSREPGLYGWDHALPGTILRSGWGGPDRVDYILSHERVHILQFDQSHFLFGDPLEGWVASRLPTWSPPLRLDLNLTSLASAALLTHLFWQLPDDQPWEWEAIYLARTRP